MNQKMGQTENEQQEGIFKHSHIVIFTKCKWSKDTPNKRDGQDVQKKQFKKAI